MTRSYGKILCQGAGVFLQKGFYETWEEAVKDIVKVIECDHADENGIVTKDAMDISREAERQFREHPEQHHTYTDSDGTEYELAFCSCAKKKVF